MQTPSQTIGPFFAYGLIPRGTGYDFETLSGNRIVSAVPDAVEIEICGTVYDGRGQEINDALLEIWQADADGRYLQGYSLFARSGTDTGGFRFHTVKPGSPGNGQAPHINVILFMRGLLNHLYTRIYFPDEMAANDADLVLCTVPDDRRGTLIARLESPAHYCFDICMQGDRETVFFDV